MDLGLKGRVAIVAAASQGLGKAVAMGLAWEGARLAICARSEDALRATAAEISSAVPGAEVLALPVDVRDYQQVRHLVDETEKRFGKIDICVANAGGPPSKPFRDTTIDDWKAGVDLNLMSTLHFAREVLPRMEKQRWGRLITITSVSVKQPIDGLILSNAVRAAVVGLVKSLSNEYARHNVLINNVCPGYTRTDRLTSLSQKLAAAEGTSPEKIQERWSNQVPMGRLGEPEEFANLVVFLASERASYITGASIAVDGGFVKGIQG